MHKEDNFSKACTETLAILNNIREEDYYKKPQSFINMLLENNNKDYQFDIDYNKEFEELELIPETYAILAYIYRHFLCNNSEKIEFYKKIIKKWKS